MAERSIALTNKQVDPHEEILGSDDVSSRPVEGSPESTLQTLFEYNPVSDEIFWSDIASARRLMGASYSGETIDRAQYDKRIASGVDEDRVKAFLGELPSYVCEYQLQNDDGGVQWVEERGGWIGTGDEKRLISVVSSMERQKEREKHLSWLATSDELTGIFNRSHLRIHVDEWLKTEGSTAAGGAYILAGIDDLGSINSDFGYEAADIVIVSIADRLKRVIGPQAIIGRVAGTKFGILIKQSSDAEIRDLCMSLLKSVRESVVETSFGAVTASVSLGAVTISDESKTSQLVMLRAEAALDQARQSGFSSCSMFSEQTEQVSTRRRNSHMSDVILTALNERRIRLAFQPIVTDLGEVPTKFECLIRMRGDDGREIPAPDFIPISERLGLVHLLDRRVLELAINTLSVCPNIHLAVNISMETVKDAVWAEGYLSLLRANQTLAKRLTVELTETQIIDAIDASMEFVAEVKKLGAKFAIDDFGAGYTSFRNLKALDIDVLKIDGSFVTGLASSRENQLFVRTLLDLARNFEMKTVAEWVDNEADAMLLKGLGVDFLQGYLLGKPETHPIWLPDGAPNEPAVARLGG